MVNLGSTEAEGERGGGGGGATVGQGGLGEVGVGGKGVEVMGKAAELVFGGGGTDWRSKVPLEDIGLPDEGGAVQPEI